MVIKSNKIIKNSIKRKPSKMVSTIARSSTNILTGGVVDQLGVGVILRTVVFIGILLIIYISNSYWVEYKINQKSNLDKSLVELRFRHIALRNEVTRLQKFSALQASLSEKGIQQWLEPPYHIKPPNQRQKTPPNQNTNGN